MAPAGRRRVLRRRWCPAWLLVVALTVLFPVGALAQGTGQETTTTAGDVTTTTSPATTSPATTAPEQTTTTSGATTTTVAGTTGASSDTSDSGPLARLDDSAIPLGSVLLAAAVLAAVVAAAVVVRRRARGAAPTVEAPAGVRASEPGPEDLSFLVELAVAMISSGAPIPQVEATLRTVSTRRGLGEPGLGLLPTTVTVSLRMGDEVRTEVGEVPSPLRMDQMDALAQLVEEAETGSVSARRGRRELKRIRSIPVPVRKPYALAGYVLATVGLVLLLRGSWPELLLGAVLGLIVGALIISTNWILTPAFLPFRPLVAATICSIAVFAAARVFDDISTFPPLVAPLVTLLPGSLLTMGVLELITGHIVAGTSRLASGAMQLFLLGLGIAAGAQLIGYGSEVSEASGTGLLGFATPWVGVLLFGLGVVWFNGALRSTVLWMLLVMYAAYAGQVIGGLFFGAELSAFFGALAFVPVAVLGSRRHGGPSPLVTFLPGFWLLVPGALGLEGVSAFLEHTSPTSINHIVTALVSMIGISLGGLVGLTLVARDPKRLWIGASPHD